MPSPLSVKAEMVPTVAPITAVSPPVVRLLSCASFAWTVIVEVEVPLAMRVAGAAEMTVWAALAAPGVKVTDVV